jgi:biopolymer transport protein ExbD
MKVQDESRPYDTINVTPMLDLAYVLLVVFILMTTASVQGLVIDMPKPSREPSREKIDLRIVQVMPDASLRLNGVPVSAAELEAALTGAKASGTKLSVAIRGDPRTNYAAVVAVIDLCNRLGVDMGLVTSRIGT